MKLCKVEELAAQGSTNDDSIYDDALRPHYRAKFHVLLDFLRACGECSNGKDLEDFVVNNIDDVIIDAEEVEGI